MKIVFNNGNDKSYQRRLNKLLKDIFLDFQFWYDLNLWDENYESYAIAMDDEIVSNICIFKAKVLYDGKIYPALSLGSVATKDEFRGKGLSRVLMEHIIDKYPNVLMYLFANEGVLDYYPRFGFRRVFEKIPVCEIIIDNVIAPVKLKCDDPKVWDYVYKKINFSQKLDCLNTMSINIFHIHWGYLKDAIYEIPQLDTMIIAEQNGSTLKLIGVFSRRDIRFAELVKHVPFRNVTTVEFGFMPYWPDIEYSMQNYEADPMFIRNTNCNLGEFKFPELSIT